jgi:membrane protein required for colicin V production
MSLGIADIIILVIVITSGLMALLRGFVREVLTIFAWFGAAAIAIYLFQFAKPAAEAIFNPPMLAGAAAFGVVFIVALIPLFILTTQIGRRLGRDDPGVIDRTGGLLFGIGRGLFLVGLAYWIHVMILEPGTMPFWAENSRLKPIIVGVGNLFPTDVNALTTSSETRSSTKNEDDSKKSEAKKDDEDYDRRGLEQLITTTSDD